MWILTTLIVSYLAIVTYCIYKQRKKDAPIRDCFNPKKWMAFARGTLLLKIFPYHILEQVFLRVNDPTCRECREASFCVKKSEDGSLKCGCNFIPKTYDPYSECVDENGWGKMILNREEYEEFRKKCPVDIEINYKNESCE